MGHLERIITMRMMKPLGKRMEKYDSERRKLIKEISTSKYMRIEATAKREPKIVKNNFIRPYVCKACGQFCECILISHAEQHGFKTKQEFLDSGLLVQV